MGCRGVLKMGESAHAEKVGRSSTERLEPAARACDIYHSSPSLRRIKKMHLSACIYMYMDIYIYIYIFVNLSVRQIK